jgi:N-acetyl-gamma-glutamyl-phosphate reductase
MVNVFIDGSEGTTGLEIRERLSKHSGFKLLSIDPDKRKDIEERRKLLNAADAVVLCLPDPAAKEAVALVTNPKVRIFDGSTAHRVAEGWVYGLPEILEEPSVLRTAPRVSVPGCHASGFLLAVTPLVRAGVIAPDALLSAHSLTGYSGGGKKRIAQYEDPARAEYLSAPSLYSLSVKHKHLPEMRAWAGLKHAPAFTPIIAGYYRGMVVSVPLHVAQLGVSGGAPAVHAALAKAYDGRRFVRVLPYPATPALEGEFQDLNTLGCNGTNRADVFVFGEADHVVVSVRIDNLGKGASGACLQCMNLAFGFAEDECLN